MRDEFRELPPGLHAGPMFGLVLSFRSLMFLRFLCALSPHMLSIPKKCGNPTSSASLIDGVLAPARGGARAGVVLENPPPVRSEHTNQEVVPGILMVKNQSFWRRHWQGICRRTIVLNCHVHTRRPKQQALVNRQPRHRLCCLISHIVFIQTD